MNILVAHSHQQGIVAWVSGGQPHATPLTKTFNIIDTCAAPNASCKLDPATCDGYGNGNIREVINNGAEDLALYPAVGEELFDGVTGIGVNVPITIAPGNGIKFRCFINGQYRFN